MKGIDRGRGRTARKLLICWMGMFEEEGHFPRFLDLDVGTPVFELGKRIVLGKRIILVNAASSARSGKNQKHPCELQFRLIQAPKAIKTQPAANQLKSRPGPESLVPL